MLRSILMPPTLTTLILILGCTPMVALPHDPAGSVEHSDGDDALGDDDDVADDDDTEGETTGWPPSSELAPWDGEFGEDVDDDGDDDDDELDLSYVSGERNLFVDFPAGVEGEYGYQDCEATYTFEGSNVTASVGDLCPSCDEIYLVEFTLAPDPQALDCVDQLGWGATPDLRLFGIQMIDDVQFAIWRNFEDPSFPLVEYGVGEFDGAVFSCNSDVTAGWWYAYWSDGSGSFGG